MESASYQIVDDFRVPNTDGRILVLDRPYGFHGTDKVTIGDRKYSFSLCSVKEWICVHSMDSFKGKTAVFVRTNTD